MITDISGYSSSNSSIDVECCGTFQVIAAKETQRKQRKTSSKQIIKTRTKVVRIWKNRDGLLPPATDL